jgi:AraC-like DNA-binding protein
MKKIKGLLERSKRGLRIDGETKKKAISLLLQIEQSEGAEKLILLFTLLCLISDSSDIKVLSSEGFTNSINQSDSERLNKVYAFIMNNFQKDITLVQAAAIANLSPTAFSRYFKSRIRKSFSEFLIHLRIGYACKLLIYEERTVTQVCYESGFQNLSNFNQQFKRQIGLTPKKYQLLHTH